ncbi:TolC family protein [Marinobacterium sediminicola]|uniref:Outer membrane protein TolC n=1 Tax=Marinobacterium sediminicola TaxID=518898 RepID=A0ABY1S2N6_9GAMM|nr:TolC family protein [Marinobacterium sediminicola]ULG68486.1 TolC family protein [Marinobacterium sediminicola]SMR76731.1 Outer membrane protein TolC [Marinobacterium sediminicola]
MTTDIKAHLRCWGVVAGLLLSSSIHATGLTLEEAVDRALANDIWLTSSHYNETAKRAMADAAGALPDPKISLALANVPTDSLNFGQEGMTQFAVGISQMLPRGDTLELKEQRFSQESRLQPLMRQQRRAQVRMQISQLWIDAWQARESLELIRLNRRLFKQLESVATSSYRVALGKTQQQDVVRAQLELTQLEDKINRLELQYDTLRARLSEWVAMPLESSAEAAVIAISSQQPDMELVRQVPAEVGDDGRARFFLQHPAVVLLDRQVEVAQTDIRLAEQSYKPAWGVSASYGYRGEDPMGRDRADLFSLGVSMEMPLFSTRRQDGELASASTRVEVIRTERLLKLRQLLAAYDTSLAAWTRLNERLSLYRKQLLPQTAQAAEAALNAYTRDAGDFAEVVRARIAELNARLAEIEIVAEQQKQVAQLNYLMTQVSQKEE